MVVFWNYVALVYTLADESILGFHDETLSSHIGTHTTRRVGVDIILLCISRWSPDH